MRRAAGGLLLLVAALAACRAEEATKKPYLPLEPEAAALRAAFNADAGAVRLVVLVAPT